MITKIHVEEIKAIISKIRWKIDQEKSYLKKQTCWLNHQNEKHTESGDHEMKNYLGPITYYCNQTKYKSKFSQEIPAQNE